MKGPLQLRICSSATCLAEVMDMSSVAFQMSIFRGAEAVGSKGVNVFSKFNPKEGSRML